ncbi:hypothetical protein [Nocardia salmonicida]|uniref:hypothetical protein n=1 Tax=Nocardia salmonicida TaxID=53431 RepID=UPI0037B61E08
MANTVTKTISGWKVVMEWAPGVGHGGPHRLTIEPADPEHPPVGGLSQGVLRKLGAIESAREVRPAEYRFDPEPLHAELADNGLSDRYLALLSAAYIGFVDAGISNAVQELADQLGKPANTIRGQLSQARKDRGIMEGRNGKPGGVLTEKGRATLQE